MELAAKAAALGVCAALMALLLKKSNAELALCLGLGAAAAILLAALGLAEDILDAAERARELPGTLFSGSEVRGHRPHLRPGLGGL